MGRGSPKGLPLCLSPGRIQGRGSHISRCPQPQLQPLPPEHSFSPPGLQVLSPSSVKVSHHLPQHFLSEQPMSLTQMQRLLTPTHAFPPQPHRARRGHRRGEGLCPRLPISQLLTGAWFAQSSQLQGLALVGMGWGAGSCPSPPSGSHLRMFTCQTECNTLPKSFPVTAWPLPILHLSTPPQHPGSHCQ